jgi:hypothetical protein
MSNHVVVFVVSFAAGLLSPALARGLSRLWPSLPEDLKYRSTVTIEPSRWLHASGVGFALLMLLILLSGGDLKSTADFVMASFLVLWALFSFWMLVPGRNQLIISRDGVQWRYLAFARSFRWREIASIRVSNRWPTSGAVSFVLVDAPESPSRLARWLGADSEVLPTNFGRKPGELLALLTEFRQLHTEVSSDISVT